MVTAMEFLRQTAEPPTSLTSGAARLSQKEPYDVGEQAQQHERSAIERAFANTAL